MNLNVMYMSKSNEWTTPQDFFDELNNEFNFNLDPCADDTNAKCKHYFTKKEDGLLQNWGGIEYFAIRLMVLKYLNGLKSVFMKAIKIILLLLCLFQLVLTQDTFMILLFIDLKYVLLKAV